MYYLILMLCMNGQCGMATLPGPAFQTEKACTDTGVGTLSKKVTASVGGIPYTYNPEKPEPPPLAVPKDFYIGQVSFFLCVERKE